MQKNTINNLKRQYQYILYSPTNIELVVGKYYKIKYHYTATYGRIREVTDKYQYLHKLYNESNGSITGTSWEYDSYSKTYSENGKNKEFNLSNISDITLIIEDN